MRSASTKYMFGPTDVHHSEAIHSVSLLQGPPSTLRFPGVPTTLSEAGIMNRLHEFHSGIQQLQQQVRAAIPADAVAPLPLDFCPRGEDVICARGKEARNHPGNVKFRSSLEVNLERYSQAPSKYKKSVVVSEIMSAVYQENGLFVRQDEMNAWFQVGHDAAREKTGQALRDMLLRQRNGNKPRPRNPKTRVKHHQPVMDDEEQQQKHQLQPRNHGKTKPQMTGEVRSATTAETIKLNRSCKERLSSSTSENKGIHDTNDLEDDNYTNELLPVASPVGHEQPSSAWLGSLPPPYHDDIKLPPTTGESKYANTGAAYCSHCYMKRASSSSSDDSRIYGCNEFNFDYFMYEPLPFNSSFVDEQTSEWLEPLAPLFHSIATMKGDERSEFQ